MGSRSIASIPARPVPSARRDCLPPAPPSWACPKKRRSTGTLLRTPREACHLPHGGRFGDRVRRGLPGLEKGLGGLRRAGVGKRRGRAVSILLSRERKAGRTSGILVVANRPGEDPVTNPHLPLRLSSMNQRSCPLTATLRWVGKAVPSCGGCMAIADSAAGLRNVGSHDVNSLQIAPRGRACSSHRPCWWGTGFRLAKPVGCVTGNGAF